MLSNAVRMSDDSEEQNPYAPPRADTEQSKVRRRRARSHGRGDVAEALERLDEHLSDPAEVAVDRVAAGRRFRPLTLILGALLVPSLAMLIAGLGDSHSVMVPIGVGLTVFTLAVGLISLFLDLALVERGKPSSPEAALKSFLKSLSMGRFGYAWSALCPTAREQTVNAPALGPVETGAGEFSLETEAGVKAYATTFARSGQGQMRSMAVKRMTVQSLEDDVAEVEAVLAFQSWPQWVNALIVVSFVIFRPLALVGAVFYFVTRKRHEASVTKTMLRGRNGAWYLLDADLREGGDGA